MKFIEKIEKDEYEKFVVNHNKSHFLQSYAWGEFSFKSRKLIPHYIGVKKNNKLVCCALLLQKKLPFGYSYFYSPRGFVIDFYDEELLYFFTKSVIKYIKKYKSIFLKIDPDIIWNEKDLNDNEIKQEKDPKTIYKSLKKIGFKHLGFTKNFETMQPRYTFRINMNKPFSEIESNFSKTTKQRIKKAEFFNTKTRIGSIKDIETFNELMKITENRKDFISHDLEYYKILYEIYNKDNQFLLFMGSVNLDEIIDNYKKELDYLEDEINLLPKENLSKSQNTKKKELSNRMDTYKKSLEEFKEYKSKYGSEITLNAHGIIIYGHKAWVLYAGNHNILTSTYSNYKTYYEHIKYCYDNGIKMYDQFGTIGDLSKDNPRLGLHEFKRKFGGNYVEFMGEWDFVTNKLMYFVFTKLVPLYRKIMLNKNKKVLKNETSNSK